VVIATTNAFGAPTKAVQTINAKHPSQGIYRSIPSLPYVRVSVDLRIDQFGIGSTVAAYDWAWDVALLSQANADIALRPSMGVFASDLTQGVRTYSAGLSAPTEVDDFPLGGSPLSEGVWYQLRAVYDRVQGVIHARVVNLATDQVVVSNTHQIPDWAGQAGEPDFTIIGIFDGELSAAITRNNVTTIDNVQVSGPEPNLAIHRTSEEQAVLIADGVPGSRYDLKYTQSLPGSGGAVWTQIQQIYFQLTPFERTEDLTTSPMRFFGLHEIAP
jgi:hypothetical protein